VLNKLELHYIESALCNSLTVFVMNISNYKSLSYYLILLDLLKKGRYIVRYLTPDIIRQFSAYLM
jgi:hypothetical protein